MKEKELLLAGNSAGSSKARHGGSVYDILVSEIKVENSITMNSACNFICADGCARLSHTH